MLANSDTHISTKSWILRQHPTSIGLRKHTDCYDQKCLKFKGTGVFHSRAELLHAALLEGDPSVSVYIPQPLRFRIGSRNYIPDCYLRRGNDRIIRELKARGEFDKEWQKLLEDYCSFKGYSFEVIANEWVFDQEQLAENWLTIMQVLARGIDRQTEAVEYKILFNRLSPDGNSFGELIDESDGESRVIMELAILRLLHAGKIKADLKHHPLDYETGVEPCI